MPENFGDSSDLIFNSQDQAKFHIPPRLSEAQVQLDILSCLKYQPFYGILCMAEMIVVLLERDPVVLRQ